MEVRPFVVVMVTGGAPGVGKSVASRRVAAEFENAGRRVERFDEADILTRPEFEELIGIWRTRTRPSLEVILDASRSYIESCRASPADTFVQDALFPFLPSLFAWGYSDHDVSDFLGRLSELCDGVALVQIHLSGDPRVSIPRAAAREVPAWLDETIQRVATFADASGVVDLPSLSDYFEKADRRTRQLLRAAPWPVVVIDADLNEAIVTREIRDAVLRFVS